MRATVRGIEIGYDVYGPEESEQTLVLLHAFPLARQQWQAQATVLARDLRLRVVTPDLRGMGGSGVPSGPATVEDMAEDVRTLLDTLGVGSFVLGGLSMGGYVAFAAWRLYPERIRALILADTRSAGDNPEGRAGREATARLAEEQGVVAVFARDAPKLLSQLTINTRPDIVDFARALAASNSAAGVASVARGLALRPDVTEFLPSITCPTLVLVGEEDAITPVAEARALFARIPDAKLEVIPDAGHLSNLEQPDRFTEAVASFLRERVLVT
jgi:3-oxoadipate enol-lactonase